MDWSQIHTWPNSDLSRRGQGPVHRWHIQDSGTGRTVLLLHGAGGSTHSYRDVIPNLARQFHVVALDLPGHGFTQLGARHRCGLDETAEDVARLCQQEGWVPEVIVGHSAGGAVALRVMADLLAQMPKPPTVWLQTPTYGNYIPILTAAHARFAQVPYYDRLKAQITFDQMLDGLKAA